MSLGSEGQLPSVPPPTDWDRALPFQLDALGVRGRLVRLGPTLDAVIERHGYPLAVARPLAEAMVLCSALATSLKYDGIFTLQISGDGPIRLLVTDLTTDGALRGYAQFDSWKLAVALGAGNDEAPDGYVPKLFGRGRLSFTVDQGQHTERYQGVVPLEGATLADCAHTYFRQSEQLPTGIKIAAERIVAGGSARWRAAALMVQQMPELDAGRIDIDREQREDDWRRAVILMASATQGEMLTPTCRAAPCSIVCSTRRGRASSTAAHWRRVAAVAESESTACCARFAVMSSTICVMRAAVFQSNASSARPSTPTTIAISTASTRPQRERQARQAHSIMRFMKASQAPIWEARMNSFGWCAWAMSPGPQTTVGTPSVWRKMPASVA